MSGSKGPERGRRSAGKGGSKGRGSAGGGGDRAKRRDGSRSGSRDDDNRRKKLPTNWPALLSLFAGTVAVAYALPFFPGALLLSVVGGYLGERGLRFAAERPGRPGRALAWWALAICAISFIFALAVAVQAQTILGDAELLRDALERVESANETGGDA